MILPVKVGDHAEFRKTVGESDVYLYAGITGDFAPKHVDEEFMRSTPYGRRIAHGTLIMGFMSAASTAIVTEAGPAERGALPVSLGYDRVRFLKPVFVGDTVQVSYTIVAIDTERLRATAKIEVNNQRDELVAVAEHVLKWVEPPHA